MQIQSEMTLPQLTATLDHAAQNQVKLDLFTYQTVERFIIARTDNNQYRQLLMDRLQLLK